MKRGMSRELLEVNGFPSLPYVGEIFPSPSSSPLNSGCGPPSSSWARDKSSSLCVTRKTSLGT